MGKNQGSYNKHTPRQFALHVPLPTTNPLAKTLYQREYMRNKLKVDPLRHWKRGPKPKRFLKKDLMPELRKLAGGR